MVIYHNMMIKLQRQKLLMSGLKYKVLKALKGKTNQNQVKASMK